MLNRLWMSRPARRLGWVGLVQTVALLAVQLLVAGCEQQTAGTTVIKFWAMGREGEVVQQLVPAFERSHPGVRVKVQQIPWSAAHEKLLTAYAGEVLPDVFQLGNSWIPEFTALKAIEPLNERIAASSAVVWPDYFKGIARTNRLQGTTYGVPWYVDTRVLFYRADLLRTAGLDHPPRTWRAWRHAMQRIRDQGKGYAILLPTNEWAPLVILALQQDAQLLAKNNQYADFQSPAVRRAFRFYTGLFRAGLAPPVGNTQVANLYQEFADGYFAFYISGPWNIGEFRQRLPKALQDDWATAPMPAPADGDYPGASLAGGASLVLARQTRHKAAAWAFIEYLSQAANQLKFYRLTGDLPARKQAWQLGSLQDDSRAHAFWVQLKHVVASPKIPEWERITTRIADYAEAVVRQRMTVDAALAGLDRDVDRILEKRRWLLKNARASGQ